MQSPLFREHVEKENWRTLYFGTLRQAYAKTRDLTPIETLLGVRKPQDARGGLLRETSQPYLAGVMED
jgi:hypothetical protein